MTPPSWRDVPHGPTSEQMRRRALAAGRRVEVSYPRVVPYLEPALRAALIEISQPPSLPGDASGAYTGASGPSDAYRATADPLAASSTVRAAVSPAHGDHEHAARSTSAARHAP